MLIKFLTDNNGGRFVLMLNDNKTLIYKEGLDEVSIECKIKHGLTKEKAIEAVKNTLSLKDMP